MTDHTKWADSEPFTFISTESPIQPTPLYDVYEELTSAKVADLDLQLTASLRAHYPDLTLTAVPASNVPLLLYAAQGGAEAMLETDTDRVVRWRGYVRGQRRGEAGRLGDVNFYAQYRYNWGKEEFLLYTVALGGTTLQYILKSPGHNETPMGHCAATDALLLAAMKALLGNEDEFVYVFDNFWQRSHELWLEVQHASWDKVILDQNMKTELQDVAGRFFDSEEVYKRYGVPWKRGLIWHGPPGNGKTISIKALMKTLYDRKEPVPTLYVKVSCHVDVAI